MTAKPNNPNFDVSANAWNAAHNIDPGTITNSMLANTIANSVSNSDRTLTISPSTGAVVASLNLGQGNTWTALQQFIPSTAGNALQVGVTPDFLVNTSTHTVTTIKNTLDDGSGNLLVAGHYTLDSAGTGIRFFQSGAFSFSFHVNNVFVLQSQDSTYAEGTEIDVVPSGTNTEARMLIGNNSAGSSLQGIQVRAVSNELRVESKSASGTYLPLNFYMGSTPNKVLSLTTGNALTSLNNTLDDGNGNFTALGEIRAYVTSGSALFLQNIVSSDSMLIHTNYAVAPTANQSTIQCFAIQSAVNGADLFDLYAQYSTNASSVINSAQFQLWSYYLNGVVFGIDLYSKLVHTSNNTLDDGSGNTIIAGYAALNGSSPVNTSPPSPSGATTGWKLGLYSNSYWIGIQGFTMDVLTGSWLSLYEGSTYPANNSSATVPDSNATVSFGNGGKGIFNGSVTLKTSALLTSSPATSGTTTVNSPFEDLLGAYWSGTASIPYGGRLYWSQDSTTPTGHFSFNLNNNGTITELLNIGLPDAVDVVLKTSVNLNLIASNTGLFRIQDTIASNWFVITSSQITEMFAVNTAGKGLAPVYAENDLTAQTAAVSSVCSFTPTATGTFEIGGYLALVSVSGGTSPSVQINLAYTDENGNTKTYYGLYGQEFNVSTGATSPSVSSIGTAGTSISLSSMTFRAKANTGITLSTQVNGSPASINYDVGAHIKQIA